MLLDHENSFLMAIVYICFEIHDKLTCGTRIGILLHPTIILFAPRYAPLYKQPILKKIGM
jgi:hypothetical protein